MSPQLLEALKRGVLVALAAAVSAGLAAYVQTGDVQLAIAAGLVAAAGALGFRGVAEGLYDGHRSATGNVKPSDVGSGPGLK
jgi:hypothetical protein